MARTEWVKLRLDNWALWKDRESRGGLGFPTQAAFLNEVSSDRYRESIIPVDEVDASVTDQAVEALRVPRPALYEVLQLYYIRGCGVQGVMRALGCARATVHANLDQADRALARWFSAKDERAAASRHHTSSNLGMQ